MNLHHALYDLALRHHLRPTQLQQLMIWAGLGREPEALTTWLWRVMALLAAAMGGMGLVMWVAANWDSWGRLGHFVLLQGAVGVMTVGALCITAARIPLGLLGFFATGTLWAYFGQTYQTGADPWQLFALWAVLTLPLCLSIRSDVLWTPWVVILCVAINLWMHAYAGHRWEMRSEDLPIHLIALAAQCLLVVALHPQFRRWTGAGLWSLRCAALLANGMVVLSSSFALFNSTVGMHYWIGLALSACAMLLLSRTKSFDILMLSATALSFNTLAVVGMARWLFVNGKEISHTANWLALGLLALALLAASVSWILRAWRQHAKNPENPENPDNTHHGCASPQASSWQQVLEQATQAQWLSEQEKTRLAQAASTQRPWPVWLFSTLGSWLAAIPMVTTLYLAFDSFFHAEGLAMMVAGIVLIAFVWWILRRPACSHFLEMLCLPILLAGFVGLGIGLHTELKQYALTYLILTMFSAVLAWTIPQRWLHVLLGAAITIFLEIFFAKVSDHSSHFIWDHDTALPWLRYALLAGWLGLSGMLNRQKWSAHVAIKLDPLLQGSCLALLYLWCSPRLFSMMFGMGMTVEVNAFQNFSLSSLLPLLCAVLAMIVAVRCWPTLRTSASLLACLVLVSLSWWIPALGGLLLILSCLAVAHHWRMAALTTLCCLWVVGAFYYHLNVPLIDKALIFLSAGSVVGLLAFLQQRLRPSNTDKYLANHALSRPGLVSALVGVFGLCTLLSVNAAIWQKEQLIREGQPVLVELAPVDPRSLMQGDYMRLNFRLPPIEKASTQRLRHAQRPFVIAKLNQHGVASLLRIDDDASSLAEGELRIELTPKNGRWQLVTDAWFFKEGDAKRWEQARYGEFRVMPDGRALLVGLSNAQRQAIEP